MFPLDEVERRAVVHALKVTDGNMSDAAQQLGIGRNTLYRKMKKYNLLP
ncbi:MAG: helix-turn-helix domain-containing protein [Candidatus Poribacteria bacterium]|nr:helix-turn-helix domain-containing protein [Candidatus Poribacteria bacterium]